MVKNKRCRYCTEKFNPKLNKQNCKYWCCIEHKEKELNVRNAFRSAILNDNIYKS